MDTLVRPACLGPMSLDESGSFGTCQHRDGISSHGVIRSYVGGIVGKRAGDAEAGLAGASERVRGEEDAERRQGCGGV